MYRRGYTGNLPIKVKSSIEWWPSIPAAQCQLKHCMTTPVQSKLSMHLKAELPWNISRKSMPLQWMHLLLTHIAGYWLKDTSTVISIGSTSTIWPPNQETNTSNHIFTLFGNGSCTIQNHMGGFVLLHYGPWLRASGSLKKKKTKS